MGRSDRPSRKWLGKARMGGLLLRLPQFGPLHRGGELGVVACERARFDARASLARCALAMTLILAALGVAASTASALTFPAVKLLDSFERASKEEPPKAGENGAPEQWRAPGWFTVGGFFEASDGGYEAGHLTTDQYGAYWRPAEYESPAVRVKLTKAPATEGKFGLWACVPSPEASVGYSGYRVEFSVTTTEHYIVTISRYDSGTEKVLATTEGVILKVGQYIGLTIHSGEVKAWVGETGGAETVVLEAHDGTYTKGYVAFFGSGTGQRLKDFEAAAEPPTVTKVETTSGPSGGGTLVTIKGTGFVSPKRPKSQCTVKPNSPPRPRPRRRALTR
jgi:hypothetical protein